MRSRVLLFCVVTALLGCKSSTTTVSTVGAVEPRDLRQADSYRDSLPGKLGLPMSQVIVRAGAGVTYVSILGVRSATEQQRIAGVLQRLNDANPKMDPLKVRFK